MSLLLRRGAEAAGVAALAGTIAGILVGGLGSRVAMRISGAMSDPALIGVARTANDNIVGSVTLEGTLALTIFVGLIPGLIGGALYAAARPWLAPLGRWAGLAFGLVLLAALGPVALEPSNFDFQRFGSPALNVAMFALLFPLFGVTIAIAHPRIAWAVHEARGRSPWTIAAWIALVPLILTFALGLGRTVSFLTGTNTEGDPRVFLLHYFFAVALGARLASGRGRVFDDARSLPGVPRVATYALLLAPAILGAPSTAQAIAILARP